MKIVYVVYQIYTLDGMPEYVCATVEKANELYDKLKLENPDKEYDIQIFTLEE